MHGTLQRGVIFVCCSYSPSPTPQSDPTYRFMDSSVDETEDRIVLDPAVMMRTYMEIIRLASVGPGQPQDPR